MRKLFIAAAALFAISFAASVGKVEAAKNIVPANLHLQVLTTCPAGASHCSLLTWTAPAADATHDLASAYNVYRSLTSTGCGVLTGAACTKIGSVSAPSVTYTDSPLTAGTQYFYVVTATNSGGESAASIQVSVTPLASAPNAPTNLTGQVK